MPKTSIGIVDYGLNNLRSVVNSLNDLNLKIEVLNNPSDFEKVGKIILPGVGSFPNAINNLRKNGLIDALNEHIIYQQKLFLGICLGMQLIFSKSHEFGLTNGLGWIDAEVSSLGNLAPSIPHIGWNDVQIENRESLLLAGLTNHSDAYFVHSFAVLDVHQEWSVGTTEHGCRFTSVVEFNNIMGSQFHPEKSQFMGAQILKNFGNLNC